MITIEVNGKDRQLITSWDDLPLYKAIELAKLKKVIPKKLLAAYKMLNETLVGGTAIKKGLEEIEQNLTEKELLKDLPVFYGKVLSICSDIPKGEISKIYAGDRNAIYSTYLEKLVFGCIFSPYDYEMKGIDHLFHDFGRVFVDGKEDKDQYKRNIVKLFLPGYTKGLPDENGNDKIPMGKSQALEFTEVADLEVSAKEMEGGRLERAANIVSILARPKGEQYDEQVSLERVPHFMHLPMNYVWEVFFCSIWLSVISAKQDRISFKAEAAQNQKGRLLHRVWTGLDGMRQRLMRQGVLRKSA